VVKQLTFFGNDPRVVPLTGFNLHDDHTAWHGSHSTNPSRSQLSKYRLSGYWLSHHG
jgi:hypothetical protein